MDPVRFFGCFFLFQVHVPKWSVEPEGIRGRSRGTHIQQTPTQKYTELVCGHINILTSDVLFFTAHTDKYSLSYGYLHQTSK